MGYMAGIIRHRNESITGERTDSASIRPPPTGTTGEPDLTGVTETRNTIGEHGEDTVIHGQIIITRTDIDIHEQIIFTGEGGAGDSRACYWLKRY